MTMFDRPHYRSYLLTMWQERTGDPVAPAVWRFSLADPRTGQRRGFPHLGALLGGLEEVIDECSAQVEPQSAADRK